MERYEEELASLTSKLKRLRRGNESSEAIRVRNQRSGTSRRLEKARKRARQACSADVGLVIEADKAACDKAKATVRTYQKKIASLTLTIARRKQDGKNVRRELRKL